MERTAESVHAVLTWNRADNHDLRLCLSGDVHTLYIPYQDGADDLFCQALGKHLARPWMEFRIQDGSHWDYYLSGGISESDNFSALPQYWDDSEHPDPELLEAWKGNPQKLARIWNLPQERIEKYLVNWGHRTDPGDPELVYRHKLTGKAYPSDQAPYGDYEQFFDFLHVLGGKEPTERHSLQLPPRAKWKS